MIYIVYDLDSGEIIKQLTCRESDLQFMVDSATQGVLTSEARIDDHLFTVVGGELKAKPAVGATPASPGYTELRAAAYPPITEQLDALWKGGAAAEEMRSQVLAVKTQFPKDADKGVTPRNGSPSPQS